MKQEIRDKLILERSSMGRDKVMDKSEIIIAKLNKLAAFKKASNVLFYASYGNEVNTHDLIKKYIGIKRVIIPKVNGEHLDLYKIKKYSDLSPGQFNIPEPLKGTKVTARSLDLVIVPGVGFDKHYNRIGHGRGFFDKLLAKTNATKIALAFDFQVINKIPSEEHDIKVDKIITEKRII